VLIVFFTLIITEQGFAQKQNNQWRFGYEGGINFNTSPPTNTPPSAILTGEGGASVADRNSGALLFYTDGVSVWNALNQIMPNGNGLLGGDPILLSSTTAAVIIPKPGSCTQYYIVTIDEQFGGNGLRYSLVDMLLDGGLGDIVPTQKNILLFNTNSEKIEVVPAQNGEDFWVITHDNPGNSFYSFLLTGSGFQTTPVVSTLGGTQVNGAGHLKVNQQFNKLACGSLFDGTMELFSLNNANGVVSDQIAWDLDPIMTNFSPLIYGVEFSPDGNLLYISNLNVIFQYDISSASSNTIQNSAYQVNTSSFNSPASMQLGPNGKIYINSGSIDVINAPNNAGVACAYEAGVLTGGGYGLPKWVYSISTTDTITTNGDTCLGSLILFTIDPANSITTANWNFGDPNSGTNNTSTAVNPTHQFSDTGTYLISCIVTLACGTDTLFKTITITDCSPPDSCNIVIIPPTDTCLQSNLFFTAQSDSLIFSLDWNFGDPNSGANNTSILINPTHQFSDTGTYTIRCIANLSCGIDTSYINVTITDCPVEPDFITIEHSTDSCLQNPVVFSINSNLLIENIIEWNFGDPNSGTNNTSLLSSPTHTFSDTGTYTVSCIVEINCSEPPTPNNPIITPCFYVDTIYTQVTIIRCEEPEPECTVYLPNAFSPNGDGINDRFQAISLCELEDYNLSIFNRWGQMIYNTNILGDKWDGTYKRLNCETGVYVYSLRYKFQSEEYKIVSGNVTLLR
jgi:gliding motility-associated-like protein